MAMFEAVEGLLAQGIQLERTVLLALVTPRGPGSPDACLEPVALRAAFVPDPAPAWDVIRGAVHRVFGDVAVVVPSVVPAPTAGRHVRGLAGDVNHFVPFRADRELMERMSGPDEGITASAYRDMARFYVELVQTGAGANAYD